ncbi:hypothetical protein GCM10009657_32700 [Oryzihumus leptocrescens]
MEMTRNCSDARHWWASQRPEPITAARARATAQPALRSARVLRIANREGCSGAGRLGSDIG